MDFWHSLKIRLPWIHKLRPRQKGPWENVYVFRVLHFRCLLLTFNTTQRKMNGLGEKERKGESESVQREKWFINLLGEEKVIEKWNYDDKGGLSFFWGENWIMRFRIKVQGKHSGSSKPNFHYRDDGWIFLYQQFPQTLIFVNSPKFYNSTDSF